MDKQKQLPSVKSISPPQNNDLPVRSDTRLTPNMDWEPTGSLDQFSQTTQATSQPAPPQPRKTVRFATEVEIHEVPRWDKVSPEFKAREEEKRARREEEEARAQAPAITTTKPFCNWCGMVIREASGGHGMFCRCAGGETIQ